MFGDKPFAIFSNWAFVITVLQSAGVLADGAFAAGVAALPVAAFAAVLFAGGGHTPLMVSTGASGGTAADVSAGAAGAGAAAVFPAGAWLACGGGDGGAACPHASAPKSTHIDQLLRIDNVLQDG